MVFLRQQGSSKKRQSSFTSPFPPPKVPKPTAAASAACERPLPLQQPPDGAPEASAVEKAVAILADAGCTLINPAGPPCLPSDHHKFRAHLQQTFTATSLRSDFLAGFSAHIESPENLHRALAPSNPDGYYMPRSDSLVRNLLLVPSIQLDIQNMLLEKLPEYFEVNSGASGTCLSLGNDIARLIINHFRWLDFIIDSDGFNDKLMQVLSICPLHLKKEIIGSLPEIIGDQNHKVVVDSLEQMLQEDSAIIVPVLDSLSNLHLDDELKEQVITIALSCIRTVDGEHIPYLLRFLLLSATPANSRRIISRIREQLKFIGVSNHCASQNKNKLKGKCLVGNTDASVLDTLRSGLRFKNILCQEIVKELSCLNRPQDHKVIDIWLLVLIYMNGESSKKSIENIFKKKIIDNCIQEVMIDQCIHGNANLMQDYFPTFLSITEYLLTCKEPRVRQFGIHMYTSLFEEFVDTFARQEILGALVTHVGSGVRFEVTAALETLKLLVSKYSMDLIPLSSHINGILDYLEAFSIENLQKVYEVFSQLALSANSRANSFGSSVANELMMIVRKQLNHSDVAYKRMGLIGTLKIVSCLGDTNHVGCSEQKSNIKEALELLQTSLDSSKGMVPLLILFYDEMTIMLDRRDLHSSILEWIGKHIGEFESIFLFDLEGGQLPSKDSHGGLEGELWMNLDGDISPICVNIFPLVFSSFHPSLTEILPANFRLLTTIERLTNQGSLGGIDALLGCPLHLPSPKYFSRAAWESLTGKEKHMACLSLYYAANWIRELLNAFCTQVAGKFECTSQTTKEDIITKLLKRLRNLVFLESLLNNLLKSCPISLPELHHCHLEHSGPSSIKHTYAFECLEKNATKKIHDTSSSKIRKNKRMAKSQTSSGTDGKLRQPSILDMFKKAGAVTSQELPNEDSASPSSKTGTSESADQNPSDYNETELDVSAATKTFDLQRFKFRPLHLHCYSILTFSKNQDSCCSDPVAELPLYLYLLRDLQYKLDIFTISGKESIAAPDYAGTTLHEFFKTIKPLFPTLKKHLDNAIRILREGDESCQAHWEMQSVAAGNPSFPSAILSKTSSSSSFIKEALHLFFKMLNLPNIQTDANLLSDLLSAFQPNVVPDNAFSGVEPCPLPNSIEYLYHGAYSYLENFLDMEALLTLESLSSLPQKLTRKPGENGKNLKLGFPESVLLNLRRRLGVSAEKLLKSHWDAKNTEDGLKSKGERLQKILHIYLENSDSTLNLLNDVACSILPQASYGTADEEVHHGFATLCPATYLVWYRVLHEVNLAILNTLVKDVLSGKPIATIGSESTKELLLKLQLSVNVMVSLVNMCRTHDKVTLHAMAVKYGGKFIESFLKVFDFLQAHFRVHNELVIQLVKELQKATRTLQTLCSEAKGLKQMAITSKVPATKRSLERFVFRVKALLLASASGCTFWMGNLKHKDLTGQVVSSQAYLDEQSGNADEEDSREVAEDDENSIPNNDDDKETE
ncbi:Fanconi anemia group D2 protein homolog isoform X2 [Punica granatum]|uniref:Fanconi anemia group D2 protein homolog isoform X2 n=1 Tax=Punica granatum TaxID=22663 RepID=A0A6P8DYJ1_PUNGR|nr:Fanconi anemia group D2 protein homolog isoform X2 [Punica granatum]